MRRSELFVPIWMTGVFLIGLVWTGLGPWRVAAPTLSDWLPAVLISAAYVVFLAYWFGMRPARRRRMTAFLQRQGFFVRSLDDPSLKSAVESLCPTPFAPRIRSAMARDGGTARFVVHGSTLYHTDFPQRENRLEEWTYVFEPRRLDVDTDLYIVWKTDRRFGSLANLKEYTTGLKPEFANDFQVLAATENGGAPPEALQDVLLHPNHSSFIGTFWLRLTPRGWGLATFPVLTEPWAKRLMEFADQLSAAMAGGPSATRANRGRAT